MFNKNAGDGKMVKSSKLYSTFELGDESALLKVEHQPLHPSDDEFNLVMLEAVDEAFSFLGESAKKAIYYHLKEKFRIKREEIPLKIDDFAEAIEEIFGMGAKIIEIQVMKNLYKRVGRKFKYIPREKDLLFTEYLKAARNHFRKSKIVKVQR